MKIDETKLAEIRAAAAEGAMMEDMNGVHKFINKLVPRSKMQVERDLTADGLGSHIPKQRLGRRWFRDRQARIEYAIAVFEAMGEPQVGPDLEQQARRNGVRVSEAQAG